MIFWLNENFWNFLQSDDDLRLKNHSCENGNFSKILQEVIFFLIFHSPLFPILLLDNIALMDTFSTSTKSQLDSNSVKSYSIFVYNFEMRFTYLHKFIMTLSFYTANPFHIYLTLQDKTHVSFNKPHLSERERGKRF